VGVDASNAADGADEGVLFDLRALSLCARGRLPARAGEARRRARDVRARPQVRHRDDRDADGELRGRCAAPPCAHGRAPTRCARLTRRPMRRRRTGRRHANAAGDAGPARVGPRRSRLRPGRSARARARPQVGAVAGLLVCHLVRAAAGAAGYAGVPASLPVYGVVGAGATLSGCLRYKATAVLITVEATGAWSLIIPVVVAVFCAELAADRLSSGVFEVGSISKPSPLITYSFGQCPFA